jgi:hypothetical protein
MIYIGMILTGFLLATVCADAMLTRDAIKRYDGKIIEANKLMVWFMAKDWRAVLISIVAAAAIVFVSYGLILAGAWYLTIAYCLGGIYIRGRIVIRNYRLNVRVM